MYAHEKDRIAVASSTLLALVLPSILRRSLLEHWLSHRNASTNGSGRQ